MVLIPKFEKFEELTDIQLLTVLLLGESRGERIEVQAGVGCVVRNRVNHPSWMGSNYKEVILKPYQFSCFLKNDPNYEKLKDVSVHIPDWAIKQCFWVANGIMTDMLIDITKGSDSYYDISIPDPKWAKESQFKVQLGKIKFYKTR